MAQFILGARLHDYGKGTPDELFGRVAADGFAAVQLAYKKCIPGVKSYDDVTPQLVADTVAAGRKHNIQVAVLGTYVELAIDDEERRLANAADFKSQPPTWPCSRPEPPGSGHSICSAKAWK